MNSTSALTARQQEVLDMLADFQRRNGYPPTQKEVAQLMGAASPNAATNMLRKLEKKGAISVSRGVARGITINGIARDDEAVSLLRAMVEGESGACERAISFLHKMESEQCK
ncbi:LexA family transcriptional regulator [Cronobacter sakazakii]|uniref:LexA family protein n=1 Tax=Cronobacter sakazakii TaxID=28141 RepID=UPI002894B05C|nr:LexA family transcriptional regulator [Cronobacter sakazakii]ELY2558605.1 LexA family transcriptional regulator [Cronobacter sakazakii]ELY3569774.1 LexA family transcriptional regulator [Cronobacter sakazakii]ELY3974836.1 LexA family transcriptional regulator [Cronobacter sakazakii]ELY6398751.1 LexA family transcriptional regulator [Cronobacter sakazakii]MDT3589289.1 LexA family transcriptional regulator [Cronobacter sakazakii]